MKRSIRLDTLYITLATASWLLLTVYTLQLTAPNWAPILDNVFSTGKVFVKNIFLSGFFLFIFLFFKDQNKKNSKNSIDSLVWPAMTINAICLSFHVTLRVLEHYVESPFELTIWLNLINNFNILASTIFCANCFYFFRRLILYQKNLTVDYVWRVFEYMIYISIVFTFINVNLDQFLTFFSLGLYAAIALFLSLQMKWVAFLNRNEKLTAIIRFSVFSVTLCLLLQNMFFESIRYGDEANRLLVIDSAHKFFVLSTFTFVLFYCISSILILLFNLPTSSAFEQKLQDNKNFKKLSQKLVANGSNDDTLKTLLDACLSSSFSTQGWIELFKSDSSKSKFLTEGLKKSEILKIQHCALGNGQNYHLKKIYLPKAQSLTKETLVANQDSLSVLIQPIIANHRVIGNIGIARGIEDGFDNDILELIDSYVSQASLTLENQVLLKKAIEHQRFLEEKKIAHSVKEKLLRKDLPLGPNIEYTLFSDSSDHVGGDYYDCAQISENKYLLVIADVSGHGTSAAFHMSQLKGIFHALAVPQSISSDLPAQMNKTLGYCLEKKSFVSMSFFFIDTDLQLIEHYRCGHNPSFLKKGGEVIKLNPGGIGLGIVEQNSFESLTEVEMIHYQPGDYLLCYTDGLTESINKEGEHFGVDRMEEMLAKRSFRSSKDLIGQVKESVELFRGNSENSDDTTCIGIKFL